MAIVCFLPLGTVNEQKASAYSSAYNGEDNTIYYFTDLFPTIDAESDEHVTTVMILAIII